MQHEYDIQQTEDPAAEDTRYIRERFRSFNDQHGGVFPSKDLHLFARRPDGQIVGGLFGDVSWGWLHVSVLWVDDDYRRRGLGTALMDRAESEAISIGVQQAFLETTDFQGLRFYEKRGYEVFAELDDQPPGHTCFYLKKRPLGR